MSKILEISERIFFISTKSQKWGCYSWKTIFWLCTLYTGGGALYCVLDPLALCFKPWIFNNWWHDSKFHVPNMKVLIQFNYCTDINKDGRTKGSYRRKRNLIKNWIEMLPLSIYWVKIIRLNHIFFEKTTY